MKNNIKAVLYVVLGVITAGLSGLGVISMFFSTTFLPVYIDKKYIMINQIIRWGAYGILLVVIILSAILADYGMKFLLKRFHKTRRR